MAAPSCRAASARHGARWEVGDIVRRHGLAYRATHRCSADHRRVLHALAACRTAALGGHLEQCASCGTTRPVYNSCPHRRFLFPVRALATVFRGNFLAGLTAAHRAERLIFAGQSAPLQEPAAWQQLLVELRATPWYVYAKAPLAGPRRVLNYLARYTHRI